MKRLILFIGLALVISGVHGATVGEYAMLELACKNKGQEVIQEMIAQLEHADGVLPNIPPEEAAYLKKERDALIALHRAQKSKEPVDFIERRYETLTARPLYNVLQVRNSLKGVQEKFAAMVAKTPGLYSRSPEASNLHRALSSIDSLSAYTIDITKLTGQPTPQGMTRQQVINLHSDALPMPGKVQDYMNCQLTKMMFVP